MAPLLPHMAEDAWQSVPFAGKTTSVFQAGWAAMPEEWRALPEAEASLWRSLLAIRGEVNATLERARVDKVLGASLEAAVLVHVESPALRAALEGLQAADNGQDALRYAFIVSEARLVGTAEEAAATAYSSAVELEEEGAGRVTVGVLRASGHKCSRCWNYSEHVGADAEHPELCERCAPVVKESGFTPAQATPVAAA